MRAPNFPYYNSDIKLQTRYVLENLKKTFEAAGSSLDHVFKAQVFLTDLGNFYAFDEVWKEYFKTPPARTTVGTTGLLVKDTLVEIDLIGYVPGRETGCKAVKSDAPQPLANYTEAFVAGGLVFAAGQLASDFKTGVPAHARRHPNFPYLCLGYKAADPLHPGQPQKDIRGGGQLARPGGQGAGVPHRPRQLLCFRRGVEGVFQNPATANYDRNDGVAGEGHAG